MIFAIQSADLTDKKWWSDDQCVLNTALNLEEM